MAQYMCSICGQDIDEKEDECPICLGVYNDDVINIAKKEIKSLKYELDNNPKLPKIRKEHCISKISYNQGFIDGYQEGKQDLKKIIKDWLINCPYRIVDGNNRQCFGEFMIEFDKLGE